MSLESSLLGPQSIVVAGVGFALWNATTGRPVLVRRWNDGQLPKVPEFRAGDGYNKRRRNGIAGVDLMVFHWTGGEQDPIAMAETLRKRRLGVEFAISRGGTVYQFCDPAEVDTADAGIVNSRSIGCEIVCYGYRSIWDLKHAFGVPKLGEDRELYEATTHGSMMKTAKFYPAQVQAALALAHAVSRAVPTIKLQVPMYNKGSLNPTDLKLFAGHIGHFHITDRKRDPGPWFMDQLRDSFEAHASGAHAVKELV